MRLELRGITKRFPGVIANQDVDLVVEPGEIHALLGENGAGKTTLMNVLYGLYQPDEGEIRIDDRVVMFHDPGQAIAAGIGMVHQHFMLVPVFTVTENVMLGVESVRGPLGQLDRPTARKRIIEISERHNLKIDPDATVEDLPVGVRQRVEIIKTLYRRSDLLVLDEPTAVLTPQEDEELFEIMRSLKAGGTSIVFITHKLNEVLEIADRITVLRRGRVVGSTTPAEATRESLASMMVGRPVELVVEKTPAHPGAPVLEVHGLVVRDDRGHVAVDGLDLQVRAGEIVVIAGVQGNGQTELVDAITGLRHPVAGTIRIGGATVRPEPRPIFEAGVAHVPEDRLEDGCVPGFTIVDNLVLNTYYRAPFSRGIRLDREAIERSATELVANFDIRTPSMFVDIGDLSGGNQQKVIVAREFSRPVRLLVAAQPTRGLDVGSVEYIHRRIVAKRDEGAAILIVSTELDEVLALADRIAVMYQGRIVDIVEPERATPQLLGMLMGGSLPLESAAAASVSPAAPGDPGT
ncbi:MAG: putative ABC transporter ATP-binding protein, simple sugar transport system ATP-binding protein [Chloroflexi bacterium CSP1-4]|nr:MAG: putative ABC transporter ATP-binding protein, simple sugar transport system ATP-binding protein [Chloroflexi bacterium CSP1-4]